MIEDSCNLTYSESEINCDSYCNLFVFSIVFHSELCALLKSYEVTEKIVRN